MFFAVAWCYFGGMYAAAPQIATLQILCAVAKVIETRSLAHRGAFADCLERVRATVLCVALRLVFCFSPAVLGLSSAYVLVAVAVVVLGVGVLVDGDGDVSVSVVLVALALCVDETGPNRKASYQRQTLLWFQFV